MKERHSLFAWLRRLVGRQPVALTDARAPLELPAWAAWADEVPAAVAAPRVPRLGRPLAAQLAVQARRNVPTSRARQGAATRSTPKPIKSTVIKRSPAARSVHLQARHLAPTRPVITVTQPVAAVLATYTATRTLLAA